ncbi:RHS repeat domain-containing protein [Flagellimonas nanhaiensis]|nr:RHS repeat-associated core domain-containing protein [Allomuricauda nanhaiensis]
MKKILITALIACFAGIISVSAQDCTNCFDDGPDGCGKLGYYDGDGDGFGTGSQTCFFGSNPANYATKGGDCNDNSSSVYPRKFYVDNDGDGYGGNTSTFICQGTSTAPSGFSRNSGDCDDSDSFITIKRTWYADVDNDTFGDSSTGSYGCTPPPGMQNPVTRGGDYDDTDGGITNVQPRTFYFDNDGDDYGTSSNTVYKSFAPTGYVEDAGDCDDNDIDINPETLWYLDADGDGLGASSTYNKVQCTQPPNDSNGSYVLNKNDLCPTVNGPQANNGCTTRNPLVVNDRDKNWIWSIAYDTDSNIKGNGINYFDGLGKPTQTQSLDIKTGQIWATQTMYDSYGRPALSTLGAPIGINGYFEYKDDFIQDSSGNAYNRADFETNPDSPSTVNAQNNTLGWYYSSNNNREPYQDVTSYPFSRVIYSELNPGTPIKAIGGNKINNEWPQGYTFTMQAGNELSQSVAFNDATYANAAYKINKTVSRDLHGVENVVFTDGDGKVLAAARSGGATSRTATLTIGGLGYVDIHVPSGSNMGFTVSANGYSITTHDLITESTVTAANSLPNGFYRVSVNDPDSYNPASPVTVTYHENYYDYALNEYDNAGRLVFSYQPIQGNNDARRTEYRYNSLGQLIYTKSPDEGVVEFRYRSDGQIRFSQNAVQATANEFSYTNYDEYGRPEESGVLQSSLFTTADVDGSLPSGTKREVVTTFYDSFPSQFNTSTYSGRTDPTFLSGNVAATQNDQCTTLYSYDVYGRLEWLVQNINGIGTIKTLDYEYDPITGMVTRVIYQKDASDEFIHRYTYNNANELIKVETSTDDISYATQAEYFYYESGGLKRVELADGVQGVDYVYNMAGQLKGINHPTLGNSSLDPGGDSNDLFGMQVDYHNADYQRALANIEATVYGTDQLNGNIKGIRWNNDPGTMVSGEQRIYSYSYDRNNWLTQAEYGAFIGTGNSNAQPTITDSNTYTSSSGNIDLEATQSITLSPNFHAQSGSDFHAKIVDLDGFNENGSGDYNVTGIEYDANGNIQRLIRNKQTSGNTNAMDNLTYHYDAAKPNRLTHVDDSSGDVSGADDIGDQAANNYSYNAIGQLTGNSAEGITYSYNAQGLVTEVTVGGNTRVKFNYNERGHRVKKESYTTGGQLSGTTYYVRDFTGNPMAMYYRPNGGSITLQEQPLYGSQRLGMRYEADNSYVYELTDHLGNVRALFKKNGSSPNLQGFTDYYPFGMTLPGMNTLGNSYRYTYQGQEKDGETNKEAFQLRLWDARIGRWLTVDPYGQFYSPYVGMGNNPIVGVDPDGGCVKGYTDDNIPIPCDNGTEIGQQVTDVNGDIWEWNGDLYAMKLDEVTVFFNSSEHKSYARNYFLLDNEASMGEYKAALAISEQKIQDVINVVEFGGLALRISEIIGLSSLSRSLAKNAIRNKRSFSPKTRLSKPVLTVNSAGVKMAVDIYEDNYVILQGSVHGKKTQIGGYFYRFGDKVIVEGADFAGEIGITGIRDLAREFAKSNGVKNVIINTGKRTTGAFPGKTQHFNFQF